jgi:hypothetical protein
MTDPAQPEETLQTIEVAVNPDGTVVINHRELPVGVDGWGHLTFTVEQTRALIDTLQEAMVLASRTQRKKGN